jgi:hypothetical protein
MIPNDARYTREIKSMVAMVKTAFRKKKKTKKRKRPFLPEKGLKFKEETNKMLHLKPSFVWC